MVSPQEVLERHRKNEEKKGFKPKSAKRGLATMFSPNLVTKPEVEPTKETKPQPTATTERGDDPVSKPVSNIEYLSKGISSDKDDFKKRSVPTGGNHSKKNVLKPYEENNLPSVKLPEKDMSLLELSKVLGLFKKLYAHDVRLYEALLEKTQYGKIRRVTIDEEDLVRFNLAKGTKLKDSRGNLLSLGLISCEMGHKSEESKRESFFFSLNEVAFKSEH